LLIIGVTTSSHYLCLKRLKSWLDDTKINSYLRLLVVFYGIIISQLVAALWFAIGFRASINLGLGSFNGDGEIAFIDIFYFSLINLTTLGMAQLEPLGNLNLLSGMEAMTGFLLVSCSASLIFKTMNQ